MSSLRTPIWSKPLYENQYRSCPKPSDTMQYD